MKVAVLGDGGWGTALAILLERKGESATIWGAFPEYVEEVKKNRNNRKFLPGISIPPAIEITSDLPAALKGAAAVLLVVPSPYLRRVCQQARPFLPEGCLLISAAKGLESGTGKRMSEVVAEVFHLDQIAVVSGPSHAEEVARNLPTTVVVASREEIIARQCQELLMEERFRVYRHDDVLGVEIGGAIKNVIAIAAGICDSLGFGDNTKAALLTRGIVEIARLGVALGAHRETFWGLSGFGDLIATSFSPYGRNLRLGRMVGEGISLRQALRSSEMVVEGVNTTKVAYNLASRLGVEMPITEEIYSVLYENKPPLQAVIDLMNRDPKPESGS